MYGALFESAPSLQSLFTTPRAVQAIRFLDGISELAEHAHDPAQLKMVVEANAFVHLDKDVTVPRIGLFWDPASMVYEPCRLLGLLVKRLRERGAGVVAVFVVRAVLAVTLRRSFSVSATVP